MNIHLWQYSEEPNAFPKALGTPTIIGGNLREDTSLLDPTIVIEAETVAYFNYVYIPDFYRYYFVKTKKCIRTNIWEITLHVDVLETYGHRVMDIPCVIERTEDTTKSNPYINDKCIMALPTYTPNVVYFDAINELIPVEFMYRDAYCFVVNTISSRGD